MRTRVWFSVFHDTSTNDMISCDYFQARIGDRHDGNSISALERQLRKPRILMQRSTSSTAAAHTINTCLCMASCCSVSVVLQILQRRVLHSNLIIVDLQLPRASHYFRQYTIHIGLPDQQHPPSRTCCALFPPLNRSFTILEERNGRLLHLAPRTIRSKYNIQRCQKPSLS